MAKKVFRIYSGADGSGWFTSNKPALKDLQNITSANGNGKLATSIPSPFARIDLVKNAFDAIGKSRDIYGDSNNHKAISDALDVAQLFFYFKKVKNRYPNAEIIAWNPNNHIQEAVINPVTELFGRTLDLFWKQDDETYNFNRVNNIYILCINHRVIGATSPATMFFAAQDVENTNIDFNFGNVTLFDTQFESIVERDDAFIKFMYAAYKHPDFAQCFPELHEYLSLGLKDLHSKNLTLWNEISGFGVNVLSDNYTQLDIGNVPPVEVCGIPVCSDQPDPTLISKNSGFLINSTRKNGQKEPLPLVLPTLNFFGAWIYTNCIWDSVVTAPVFDPRPIKERTLPGQADKYPYLTIGDFLEDNLVELSYDINEKKFYTFGLDRYLLPLKPLFFEYFSVKDIVRENMISVDMTVPNAVRINLSIPTRDGKIEYVKIYSEDKLFSRDIHLGMFPLLVDPLNKIPLDYHVGMIDQCENSRNPIDLELYNQDNRIKCINKIERLVKHGKEGSYNYKTNESFESIRLISDNDVNGFILPKYTFIDIKSMIASVAIDFGTTNTHIECKYDGGQEKSFEVKDVYGSLAVVNKMGRREMTEQLLEAEVFPKEIGEGSQYRFPLRTALLENNNTKWGASPSLFQDSNVGYSYEKTSVKSHHNVITNLKWNNLRDSVEKLKVEHFVNGLLEGIKYKLLADGIDLPNTTIKWLYPVSMTFNQRVLLKNIWEKAVHDVFGEKTIVESIPESIAPYTFYFKTRGLQGLTASIDIGGGTSDIAIFNNGSTEMISSVGFAGNAVLGDGYNATLPINGFYKAFSKKFQKACDNKGATLQKNILDQLVNGKNPDSSNFNSFLFSVDNSVFDYSNEMVLHPTMKFSYLVFYASQAFYLANMMSRSNLDVPQNIIFSGSGSKSLNIVDQDKERSLTKKLFDFFFNEIYKSDESDIKIELTSNPKEITCKGALLSKSTNVKNKIGFWVGGNDDFNQVIYESNTDVPDYKTAKTAAFKKDILNSLDRFFELFDKYERKNNFSELYGIDNRAMDLFKKIQSRNLESYLDRGIEDKLQVARNDKAPITEGLFFYPLIGLLNNLATELADIKN